VEENQASLIIHNGIILDLVCGVYGSLSVGGDTVVEVGFGLIYIIGVMVW
jgi:hypothetical protein